MQGRFDFGRSDITCWRDRLKPMLDGVPPLPALSPTGQLVKSMISSRTQDEVSAAAYDQLKARYRNSARLAAARPADVEKVIADVSFADAKAEYVVEALRRIEAQRGDFQLAFLGDVSIHAALGWLERLPGVGRKVAASVLNASLLGRPVFIVDTHVMRVLGRLGFVSPRSRPRLASEAVTATMTDWAAHDFLLFHVQLKRLGQQICHDRTPECGRCPLADDCPTAQTPR